jgi:hypothetical protein
LLCQLFGYLFRDLGLALFADVEFIGFICTAVSARRSAPALIGATFRSGRFWRSGCC